MLPNRPEQLHGTTYRVSTPVGTMHLTVNRNSRDEILETFVHMGKKGEHSHAMAEAIGRLISSILRMDELGMRKERLELIIDQLEHIGGGAPVGLGPSRVSSVPDGIAKVLAGKIPVDDPNVAIGPEAGCAG